ncbi:hypothetical protein AGMMS50255_2710 [Spirochaetia bacterium]|nr:hypothetical protein AGMMS50255_2710 [Spirochaetia bacterium]
MSVTRHTADEGFNNPLWIVKNGQEQKQEKRRVIFNNREKRKTLHPNDFYETPYILTRELVNLNIFPKDSIIYDPCCGKQAIGKILKENGYEVIEDDITTNGKDFLQCQKQYDYLVMNPPFNQYDDFILKAKEVTNKVFASIIPMDYLSTCNRQYNGVWKHLKKIFVFNQKISYAGSPDSFDTSFHATAWGIWDMEYNGDSQEFSILDIQKYKGAKGKGSKTKAVIEKPTQPKNTGITNVKQYLVDNSNMYMTGRNKENFIRQLQELPKVYEAHRPMMLVKYQKSSKTIERFTKKIIVYMNEGRELDALILVNALVSFWNNKSHFDFRSFKNDYNPEDDNLVQRYEPKRGGTALEKWGIGKTA